MLTMRLLGASFPVHHSITVFFGLCLFLGTQLHQAAFTTPLELMSYAPILCCIRKGCLSLSMGVGAPCPKHVAGSLHKLHYTLNIHPYTIAFNFPDIHQS